MSAIVTAYGRLARDPIVRTTQAGKPMAFATIAVDMQKRTGGETEKGTLWLGVTCFGRHADALGECAKGDTVHAMGRMQLSTFTPRDGGPAKESQEIVVDSLVTPYGAKRAPSTSPAEQPPPQDEVPW